MFHVRHTMMQRSQHTELLDICYKGCNCNNRHIFQAQLEADKPSRDQLELNTVLTITKSLLAIAEQPQSVVSA